jgi:hypothetical protein
MKTDFTVREARLDIGETLLDQIVEAAMRRRP